MLAVRLPARQGAPGRAAAETKASKRWARHPLSVWAWLALVLLCLPVAGWAAPAFDPQAAVQTHLGLFLTVPTRRDEGERIQLTRDRLEIWFLKPLGTAPDEAVCDGLRWLLTGRLAQSAGAHALFQALPGVQQITLVFYAVETEVAPEGDGHYRQRRSAAPQARFTISRERAASLNPKQLRSTLTGARCVPLGRRLVDELWRR